MIWYGSGSLSPNGQLETEHSFETKSRYVKVCLEWASKTSPLIPKIPAPRKDTSPLHVTGAMIPRHRHQDSKDKC
jgi:hypothetical protein